MRRVLMSLVIGLVILGAAPPAHAAQFFEAYQVWIHTCDEDYAGTDGRIYAQVLGSTAVSAYWRVDHDRDGFERGDMDWFELPTNGVGTARALRLYFVRVGEHPGWCVDFVTLYSPVTHRWLDYYQTRWIEFTGEYLYYPPSYSFVWP